MTCSLHAALEFTLRLVEDVFRASTIVDVHTREAVAIEVGQSLQADDVVRTLNQLKLDRGVPKVLFCATAASSPVRRWIYGLIATA